MSLRGLLRAVSIAASGVLALSMTIPVAMRFATDNRMYEGPEDVPQTQVALVLGASVYRGRPSPVLEERAHTAVALYMKGKVSKILVTGDNGALTHDEVTPVRKYLISAGVPPGDIFLDHAGFDTYSSMYRARDVFLAQSMTIVTQDFHMPRALYIARRLGIESYGVVPKQSQGRMENYMREIPASVKALYDLTYGRIPKYLGPTISLEGDGSVTWY